MTFSINHGSKRGLNLILHIMVIKYGEKAGKIKFNRSDKMEISKSDIFFCSPFIKEVRSILEMAVPVWHPGLTQREKSEIESVQKLALKIILGHSYQSYRQAREFFCLDTLEQRRSELCLKFAKKNMQSENCFFTRIDKSVISRRKPDLVNGKGVYL